MRAKNSSKSLSRHVTWLVLVLIIIVTLCMLLCWPRKPEVEIEKVTVAAQKSVYNGLIYVAFAKDYWKQEGVDVTLKEFAVGRLCLEAVLGGNADLSTVSDFPIALAGLSKQKLFIVTTVAWGDGDIKIVARKDHGISSQADLKGKKVATFLGTAPEFYLRRFLEKYGIDSAEVQIVNLKPEDMVNALTRGDIDASVIWEPFGYHAEKQLKENATIFVEKGMYSVAHNLVVTQEFAERNPKTLDAVLRALFRAEKFIKDNPSEAIQIISKSTDLQPEVLKGIWDNYRLQLTLEDSLLAQLDAIAKWAKERKMAPKDAEIPDYRGLIYSKSLEKAKPSGIRLGGK